MGAPSHLWRLIDGAIRAPAIPVPLSSGIPEGINGAPPAIGPSSNMQPGCHDAGRTSAICRARGERRRSPCGAESGGRMAQGQPPAAKVGAHRLLRARVGSAWRNRRRTRPRGRKVGATESRFFFFLFFFLFFFFFFSFFLFVLFFLSFFFFFFFFSEQARPWVDFELVG